MAMAFFKSPLLVIASSILLRLLLLLWGHYQDTHSPLKYTDIDYLVFTDASRYLARARSPYDRATYRYTPLLAWLLYPTVWGGLWFEFGKVLFAVGDVVTGVLVFLILSSRRSGGGGGGGGGQGKVGSMGGIGGMETEKALRYASIWLLNPMVANISTRGSSEGLLAVIVTALLWAVLRGHVRLAGVLLGLAVHFKIYPFIYAASVFWYLDGARGGGGVQDGTGWGRVRRFVNKERCRLALYSAVTFMGLNVAMYRMYGFLFFLDISPFQPQTG